MKIWLGALLCVCSWSVYAQGNILFGNIADLDSLKVALVENFTPKFVFHRTHAEKITLKEIYNQSDTVWTLYQDHTLNLPPDEKWVSYYLAKEGADHGIKVSPILPMRSPSGANNYKLLADLYNLAPMRWDIYTDRKNNPHQKDILLPTIDTRKGDVARSIFYTYAIYRDLLAPQLVEKIENKKSTLCQWHDSDPVDLKEHHINILKASYQANTPNPFIMDPTLANRLYCADNTQKAISSLDQYPSEWYNELLAQKTTLQPHIKILNHQNAGIYKLDISDIKPKRYLLQIFGKNGQLIYSLDERLDYFNTINLWNAKPGLYYFYMFDVESGARYADTFKIVG